MRINFLGGAETGMTEGKLHIADVGSAVGPKGGRAMAEKMGIDIAPDDALSVSFDKTVESCAVEFVPEFVPIRFISFGFIFIGFHFTLVLMGSEQIVFIGGPRGADTGGEVIPDNGLGKRHEGDVSFL